MSGVCSLMPYWGSTDLRLWRCQVVDYDARRAHISTHSDTTDPTEFPAPQAVLPTVLYHKLFETGYWDD